DCDFQSLSWATWATNTPLTQPQCLENDRFMHTWCTDRSEETPQPCRRREYLREKVGQLGNSPPVMHDSVRSPIASEILHRNLVFAYLSRVATFILTKSAKLI